VKPMMIIYEFNNRYVFQYLFSVFPSFSLGRVSKLFYGREWHVLSSSFEFLGAFANLPKNKKKAATCFVKPVRPSVGLSARNNWALTGPIFIKLDI